MSNHISPTLHCLLKLCQNFAEPVEGHCFVTPTFLLSAFLFFWNLACEDGAGDDVKLGKPRQSISLCEPSSSPVRGRERAWRRRRAEANEGTSIPYFGRFCRALRATSGCLRRAQRPGNSEWTYKLSAVVADRQTHTLTNEVLTCLGIRRKHHTPLGCDYV